MIDNNEKLFEYVDNLRQVLDFRGQADLARRLENALVISTVPGEILGQLRIELEEIAHGVPQLSGELERNLYESLKYLDKIL